MGAAVVGQYIHPPVPVASDGSMRHKAPEVLRQVLLRVVPGEMHRLGPHLVQQGDVVRVRQPDVQSLGEVHQRPAGGKLFQQRLMVRAGQQVGVQQFDLVLAAPKFREVSDFDAPAPLLAADNAKSAVPRTAPAQKSRRPFPKTADTKSSPAGCARSHRGGPCRPAHSPYRPG